MAAVLLLFASLSSAEPPACSELFASQHERAGITRADWDAMCARGEDPGAYYRRRLGEKQQASGDEAVVRRYLDMPVSKMRDDEMVAFASVDQKKLPKKLKKRYREKLWDIYQKRYGIGGERPKKCGKKEVRAFEREARALRETKMERLGWLECEWLRELIECTFDEMEKVLAFRLLYDCRVPTYVCFLHPSDPTAAYLVHYRAGRRTRAEVEGTKFFGIGNKVMSCRDGDFKGLHE